MFSSPDLCVGSMGRQQNILLLCLFLGEQEQNCSHTLHDVVGGGDDILSLDLDDQEIIPPWEGLLMCSNIMGDVFDKEHVKRRSYEITEASMQEPITLSLGSLDCLMECSQDHFTYYALRRHV